METEHRVDQIVRALKANQNALPGTLLQQKAHQHQDYDQDKTKLLLESSWKKRRSVKLTLISADRTLRTSEDPHAHFSFLYPWVKRGSARLVYCTVPVASMICTYVYHTTVPLGQARNQVISVLVPLGLDLPK